MLPYHFAYKAVTSTSSVIVPESHRQEMLRFPYDHILYKPGQICRTCHFLKPARSKHCGICKVCVAKHDHHCVWVMNCLGRGNYIHFLGLMASLGILLNYGAYLAYSILDELLQREVSKSNSVSNVRLSWSVDLTWLDYIHSWGWALVQDFQIGGVGLLALLTGPLAWGLFWYHVYLIWAGMTTNESSKWADWRDDIADGLVFSRKRNRYGSKDTHRDTNMEPSIDWPIKTTQEITTFPDGHPPRRADGDGNRGEKSITNDWVQVQSLDEVENLYDLGFWDNLHNILPRN